MAYIETGDDASAIDDFDEVLRIKPDDIKALHNRGLAYACSGERGLAIEDFTGVLRIDPDNVDAKKMLMYISGVAPRSTSPRRRAPMKKRRW